MPNFVRANQVYGDLDAAINDTEDVISSPGLARLPVVASPNYAKIILRDADTGDFEILWVMVHEADATTAQVSRAMEDTTALAWASGSSWVHGPTAADFTPVVSTPLLAPSYKGAWDADTYYNLGEKVTHASKLWEVIVEPPNDYFPAGPTTDNYGAAAASDPSYVGGPTGPNYLNLGSILCQHWVCTDGGEFTGVRAWTLNSAPVEVHFCTSMPSNFNAGAAAAVASATFAGGTGAYSAVGDLDVPLELGPGDDIWVIASTTVGVSTIYGTYGPDIPESDPAWQPLNGVTQNGLREAGSKSGSWSLVAGPGAWHLGIQLLKPGTDAVTGFPVWGLALDFGA